MVKRLDDTSNLDFETRRAVILYKCRLCQAICEQFDLGAGRARDRLRDTIRWIDRRSNIDGLPSLMIHDCGKSQTGKTLVGLCDLIGYKIL